MIWLYHMNIKKLVLFFTAAFILMLLPHQNISAESAWITMSVEEDTLEMESEFLVTIQVSSDVVLGDFEAFFSYNPEVLEFVPSASFIAGGEGLLRLSHLQVTTQETSRKYVMKFKAIGLGSSEIGMTERGSVYEYETGNEMSVSSNSITVQVKAVVDASNNHALQSLEVVPGTLFPEFQKDQLEYSLGVDVDVNQLVISAITEEPLATTAIFGNENLKSGENEIILQVKAESGEFREYVLHVIKEYESEEQEAERSEELEDQSSMESEDPISSYEEVKDRSFTEINQLYVMKEEDAIFIQNGFRYEIIPLPDDVVLPENYIKSMVMIDHVTMIGYVLKENSEEDEKFLIYAKNESGKEGFYQYDSKEQTLQRYFASTSTDVLTSESNSRLLIILLGIIGILITSNITFLYFLIKKSR